MRCLGTDIEMSLRACLAPYHRFNFSISTIGASMIPAGAACGFRLAVTCIDGLLQDGGPREGPPNPPALGAVDAYRDTPRGPAALGAVDACRDTPRGPAALGVV